MPARFKPNLSIVNDTDLLFQIAVGYEASIPIDELGITAAAIMPQADIATGIIQAQRKNGAVLLRKKNVSGPDSFVWSDWTPLVLFSLTSGSLVGFAGKAYGFFG